MRAVRELVLTAGAVLGAACLAMGLVAVVAGVDVLVFRSGSMAPAIETGDLAFTETVEATDVHRGDVVSVLDADGQRVTHRVVGLSAVGGRHELTLKGDANEQADREVYTVTEVQRVLFVVPRAGYLVAWATGPVGLVLLGGYATFLVSVLIRRRSGGHEDPRPPSGRTPPKRRAARPARRRAPATLASMVGGAIAILPTQAWAAPWTNPVTATGTFTATTVPAPTLSCGALGLLSVRFNWTAVAGATNYTLHHGSGGSQTLTLTGTTHTLTGAISGGTAWVVANRNFGSTTWSSVASNTRSYTVAVVSLCS